MEINTVSNDLADLARRSDLFTKWLNQVSPSFTINNIELQSVDTVMRAGVPTVLFIKLKALVRDARGNESTKIFFLRGPSVGLLVVLVCDGGEYVLLVNQARPAIGEESFPELPAGMVEAEGVTGAALRELEEETGITVTAKELIDLSTYFYTGFWRGIYPSPGACDEHVHLFLCKKQVTREQLDMVRDKATGNKDEHEFITLRVVRLEDLCRSTPDPKAHSAYVMYSHLKTLELK